MHRWTVFVNLNVLEGQCSSMFVGCFGFCIWIESYDLVFEWPGAVSCTGEALCCLVGEIQL
jgi:nitrate reductase NapE component